MSFFDPGLEFEPLARASRKSMSSIKINLRDKGK